MPRTKTVFYMSGDGSVPLLEWLLAVKRDNKRAFAKCIAAIVRLEELGYELRRPEADTLRNGISELRVRLGHVNYRILYSIHNRDLAVLLHGLTKERVIPNSCIDLCIDRLNEFKEDPIAHTYTEEI